MMYPWADIYLYWGGPGWYAAQTYEGVKGRAYYLVADRSTNFGVGPTVWLYSVWHAFQKWHGFDVDVPVCRPLNFTW